MTRARLTATAALAAALGLAGCVAGPNYSLPSEALVRAPTATGPFVGAASPAVSVAEPPDGWWRLYRDPKLDALVAKAFAANTDLRVADANLERSQALLQAVRAARQPSATVGADVGYDQVAGEAYLLDQPVPAMGLYDVGLTVSYDLDLAGRLRRTIEAAKADDEAVEAARDLVKVNVAAETTRAYVEICDDGAELAAARRTLALQQAQLALTRRLIAAGRSASLDATRAQGQVAQLAAAVPALEARRRNAEYRLAVITGRPPAEYDASLEQCVSPPQITAPLPVGDGAALLRRRPDVRGAERRLAASTAEIGVATADLYPDVSLVGQIGSTGKVTDLLTAPTNLFGIGPSVRWSLNQNAARAHIAAAKAGTKADLARFDGTVLRALGETESVLNVYAHDLERQAAVEDAARQADKAAEDAHRLEAAGRSNALAVAEADRNAAAAQQLVAAQTSQVSQDQVSLFLALGGGWR